MHFSPAQPTDMEPLLDMTLALWPDTEREEERAAWLAAMADEEQLVLLAKAEQVYVGFCHCTIRTDYVPGAATNRVAYLEAIYVQPVYRQQGVASELLKAAEQWAVTKGCTELGSDTGTDNTTAMQWHQQAGFTEVERMVCYIKRIAD
jgi:aminoglycoside 6'-N-acetyltransferase I